MTDIVRTKYPRSTSTGAPVKTWQYWYSSKDNIDRLPPFRRSLINRPKYVKQARDLQEKRDKIEQGYQEYIRETHRRRRIESLSAQALRRSFNDMNQSLNLTTRTNRTFSDSFQKTDRSINPDSISSPMSSASTPHNSLNMSLPVAISFTKSRPATKETITTSARRSVSAPRRCDLLDVDYSMSQLEDFCSRLKTNKLYTTNLSQKLGSEKSPNSSPLEETADDDTFPDVQNDIDAPIPRFSQNQINELTNTYNLYIKKKIPDIITYQDAVTAMRAAGYLVLDKDVRKANQEFNDGGDMVSLDVFLKIISTIPIVQPDEIDTAMDIVPREDEDPKNVDLQKLRTILLTEGERMTIEECDHLFREIIPPPPPEDPKKKKKPVKKKKNGEPEEEAKPKIILKLDRFIDLVPQRILIEQQPTVVETKKKKK
ncbi:hypothetical protein BLNAU_13497 [Blattamonas nauphoetae]|uniref:Uncharacterized protein n=1 Tax=Blattamonas nauphoetae TaxID=2049346 RepID=A0ABQ9XGN3_9EUKA|nr:hypothetical protein BLNAU_13497 [Blattamonas nauphoetae]